MGGRLLLTALPVCSLLYINRNRPAGRRRVGGWVGGRRRVGRVGVGGVIHTHSHVGGREKEEEEEEEEEEEGVGGRVRFEVLPPVVGRR